MQNRLDRAKQFLAFDALSGYGSLINKTKNIKYKDKFIYLDDDYNNEINNCLNNINKNNLIRIKYYDGDSYIESSGKIKKIDNYRRKIYFLNTIIDIDSIVDIEVIDNLRL